MKPLDSPITYLAHRNFLKSVQYFYFEMHLYFNLTINSIKGRSMSLESLKRRGLQKIWYKQARFPHARLNTIRGLHYAYEGRLNVKKDDIIWKKLPSLATGRAGHTAFHFCSRVFVLGGYTKINQKTFYSTSETFNISVKSRYATLNFLCTNRCLKQLQIP